MTVKPGWARKRPAVSRTLPSTREQPRAPTPGERPLWDLSRDEQRALTITFIGGLSSIILSAVVIGAAISLAHVIAASPKRTKAAEEIYVWTTVGAGTLFFLSVIVSVIVDARRGSPFVPTQRLAAMASCCMVFSSAGSLDVWPGDSYADRHSRGGQVTPARLPGSCRGPGRLVALRRESTTGFGASVAPAGGLCKSTTGYQVAGHAYYPPRVIARSRFMIACISGVGCWGPK
jgi:hypothetical protein